MSDINELDVNDIGLKGLFGERFHDETESKPVTAEPKKVSTDATTTAKTAQRVAGGTQKEEWRPQRERNWMDDLKDCAKTAITFGGLNALIFYWQMAGLMDSSIAVPSMCVCCALMGMGIGKVVGKK